MSAYYNEFDPFAAAWLRELIKAGHIAPGDVDERSIKDVKADDLRGYTQCHFFAGIGVWSHALRSAGWSDERPVWTGSCPCQPFSAAGKGGGFDDERHLWPDFFRLIAECRPDVVLGEQVASKDGLGWLDLVYADLEGADYAVGAVDTCAAGFGAPHIRQRLYWCGVGQMADTELPAQPRQRPVGGPTLRQQDADGPAGSRVAVGLDGDARHAGLLQGQAAPASLGLADASIVGRERGRSGEAGDEPGTLERPERLRDADGLGNALGGRRQPQPSILREYEDGVGEGRRQQVACVQAGGDVLDGPRRPGPTNGLWRDADWLGCRDGKWRPVEPGTFPLAHGAAARVGRLRGYGNAIVAPQAQAFVEAVMSCS